MRILALDPSASKTGFAIFDPPAEEEMRVGTFPCDGDTHERRADSMATALIQLINAHKPGKRGSVVSLKWVSWRAAVRRDPLKPEDEPSGGGMTLPLFRSL